MDLFDLSARYYDRIFGLRDPERMLDALWDADARRFPQIEPRHSARICEDLRPAFS